MSESEHKTQISDSQTPPRRQKPFDPRRSPSAIQFSKITLRPRARTETIRLLIKCPTESSADRHRHTPEAVRFRSRRGFEGADQLGRKVRGGNSDPTHCDTAFLPTLRGFGLPGRRFGGPRERIESGRNPRGRRTSGLQRTKSEVKQPGNQPEIEWTENSVFGMESSH